MKNFLLRKLKGEIQIMQIPSSLSRIVEDDWTRCLCSTKFIQNEIPFKKSFKEGTAPYEKLWNYFKKVNLFLPRIEIPNKKVTTDVEGTSKLIRRPDAGIIEIAYRRRNKSGKIECGAKSPNTCYISNADREKFFRDVKYLGTIERGKYGDRYYIPESDGSYDIWSDFMDAEYTRLSGIEFRKKRPKTRPKILDEEARRNIWRILVESYSALPSEKLKECFENLAERELCKLNQTGEWVYDKDGFFIEEMKYFDGISEIRGLAHPLTNTEMSEVVGVIKSF